MIGIIKGDVRYTYLSQMLDNTILSNAIKDFSNVDKLILPLGGINKDYTIKQSNINILDIIKNNSINTIYTGNANNELIELCKKYNITLYEMLKDSKFVRENAFLTAKGLLYFIHQGNKELSDRKVLIIGYGNIGFYLAKLLTSLNVDFDIYTQNPIEKKFIELNQYHNVNDIKDTYDIIINTIPNPMDINYEVLKNSRVIDVASPPYGFNLDKIQTYGIHYEVISAIPSKFAPISAANLIKKFIENHR